MSKSVDIFTPDGTVTYTEGSGGVSQINVRFQFANVVDIRIYFDDSTLERYYQVPCKVTTSP
jgi:hypothetical protein